MTVSTKDREEAEGRCEPAQVYCAIHAPGHWIVDPPRAAASAEGSKIFTGLRAQYNALLYAHEKFGSARFFPY